MTAGIPVPRRAGDPIIRVRVARYSNGQLAPGWRHWVCLDETRHGLLHPEAVPLGALAIRIEQHVRLYHPDRRPSGRNQ